MKIHASAIGVQAPYVAEVVITGRHGDTTQKALTKVDALALAADLIHYATGGSHLADRVRDAARRADADDEMDAEIMRAEGWSDNWADRAAERLAARKAPGGDLYATNGLDRDAIWNADVPR